MTKKTTKTTFRMNGWIYTYNESMTSNWGWPEGLKGQRMLTPRFERRDQNEAETRFRIQREARPSEQILGATARRRGPGKDGERI